MFLCHLENKRTEDGIMATTICFVSAIKTFNTLKMTLIRSFEEAECTGLEQCLPCDKNGRFQWIALPSHIESLLNYALNFSYEVRASVSLAREDSHRDRSIHSKSRRSDSICSPRSQIQFSKPIVAES